MHIEDTSTVIEQPVQKVFDYVSNPVTYPEWIGPYVEVRDLQQSMPGELREGDKFTADLKFLGRRVETTIEVTASEPNRRLKQRSIGGPVPIEVSLIFEEVPGGTRLTQSADLEPPGGFFKLTGPLLERAVKRQFRNDQETLKDVLEAQG
jgi:uncharacterized membrane protein